MKKREFGGEKENERVGKPPLRPRREKRRPITTKAKRTSNSSSDVRNFNERMRLTNSRSNNFLNRQTKNVGGSKLAD